MRRLLLQPVLIPIGQPLGMVYRAGENLPAYRVRVGDDVFQLSAEQATVWDLAHRCSPGTTRGHTRAELEESTETYGAFRVAEVIDWLREHELLIELPVVGSGMVDFARNFRLAALMLGLGNAPDRRDTFAFGVGEDGFALASLLVAEVTARGASMPSLYGICQALASNLAVPDYREYSDPDVFLAHVLEHIHPQLETHAVYVDRALGGVDG